MKNKVLNIILLSSTLCALSLSAIASISFKKPIGTHAYDTNSLPTTIDLNDSTEEEVRSYYSNLNSLKDSEKNKENLLKNLKPILSNGQKYYSYDSGNAIWNIYAISDRDWENSPAKDVGEGTYNSATNTITNYKYGSNNNDNPYVHSLYVSRNYVKEHGNPTKAFGNHTQGENGINREHIWPKSRGFDEVLETTGGARGDLMHLWAADGYTNNIHGNNAYGYVDKSKSYTDCNSKIKYSVGNYLGTSKTLGSGTVFEPQDDDKGDIARAIFYMAARYNNISGTDNNIDANNPNLTIKNITWGVTDSGTSTKDTPFAMGILDDLLEWHRSDPVDEYEIHRNNLLYKNFTNNRNPFIDFPEWVEYIWGTKQDLAVDPTKDELNVGKTQPSEKPSSNTNIFNDLIEFMKSNPVIAIIIGAIVLAIIIVVIIILAKSSKGGKGGKGGKSSVKPIKKVINYASKEIKKGGGSSSGKKTTSNKPKSKK